MAAASNPNPDLTFRLATQADAEPLASLINASFRHDPTTQVFLSPNHAGIDVINAAALAARLAEPDNAVLAITAAGDGSIVAHGAVCKLDEDRAWFSLLAVDVGRQRQGLGGQVLAWAEEYARRELGCRRLEFDVVCTRVELIAWYTKRGYRLTGVTKPFPYDVHGEWRGVLRDDLYFVLMGKDLSV